MNPKLFKNEAIQKTLKSIDKLPINWVTTNDKINLRILDGILSFRSDVELITNEVPISECFIGDSFFLITTTRVISKLDGHQDELLIKEILKLEDLRENYIKDENGVWPKTNLFIVKGENEKQLTLKVDSVHPAYFVKILIYNLSSYLRHGIWYLDPSRSYR